MNRERFHNQQVARSSIAAPIEAGAMAEEAGGGEQPLSYHETRVRDQCLSHGVLVWIDWIIPFPARPPVHR